MLKNKQNTKTFVGANMFARCYNGISKNGITLISLVITIIIILILAGVGISGSLSLIEQARYTAFINEMKQINEAVLMQIYERQIESASNGQPYEPFPIEYKVTKEEFERLPESLKYEVLYIRELLKEEDVGEKVPTEQYYGAEEIDLEGMFFVAPESGGGKEKTYIHDEQSASVYKVEPTVVWGVEMYGYEYGELLVSQPGLLEKAKSSNNATYPEIKIETERIESTNTVNIIVIAKEGKNGITKIELLDSAQYEEYDEEKSEITKIFNVSENGEYKIKVTTPEVDSTKKITVAGIGPTAPTLEVVTGDKGENDWYKTNVGIKVTQGNARGVVGIDKTTYTIKNTAGETVKEETEIENEGIIEITEDGEYKIIAYTYDTKNGKSIGAELEVNKDATVPKIKTALSNSNITTSGFTLNVEATDETSGIQRYEYYVGGIKYNSKTITGLKEGTTYSVYVKIYDKAGNILTTSTINVTTKTVIESLTDTAATKNTYIKDKYGNKIVIPKDFKVVKNGTSYVEYKYDKNGSTSTGIPVVQDGIVIEHKDDKNQFVWVPVGVIKNDAVEDTTNTTEIKLGRYATYTMNTTTTIPTPPEPTQLAKNWSTHVAIRNHDGYWEMREYEQNSSYTNIKAYNLQTWLETTQSNGGYYIARYEASYSDGTKPLSQPSKGVPAKYNNNNPPTTRTTGQLWNWITQPNAATASQAMYPNQTVTNAEYYSDLVNSYAWDTAIIFIQTYSGNTTYASKKSAYLDTSSSSYQPANTGERGDVVEVAGSEDTTDKACNIYDMASNEVEWSTETSNYSGYPCTYRGSNFASDTYYTSLRNPHNITIRSVSIGFRPLLYVRSEQ